MRATKLALAAATLAVSTFLLTGCEPTATAAGGGSGSSNGLGVNCDTGGWGPLSGCDNASSPSGGSANDTKPVEDNSSNGSAKEEPDGADSSSCAADKNDHGVDTNRFDEAGDSWPEADGKEYDCATTSPEPEPDTPDEDGKNTDVTVHRYTVTVTWIVVRIDVTGFRECVIDLRKATSESDNYFSRRITTREDCQQQRINAVYRPTNH